MSNLNVIRLCLSIMALGLFFWGIQTEREELRWAAVACLGIAVILRFFGPKNNPKR